jgi:ribosome-associated protein
MVKPRKSLSKPSDQAADLETDKSVQIAKRCAFLAYEKKAENINVLDVAKLTSFADNFVICSAASERQAQSIARDVMATMKEEGAMVLSIEGLTEGHWVLVDLGDVVFHVFTQEARGYYDLDGLWADAAVVQHYDNTDVATRAHIS